MSVKKVRSKLGGYTLVYIPPVQLHPIIEEPELVISEESDSKSDYDSGYAVSEYEWSDNEDIELITTISINQLDHDIYSTLLNITKLLRQSGCKEFKRYQAAFDKYLVDYSTYANNVQTFMEHIKAIYLVDNSETTGCCTFFKKKPPTNTLANSLIQMLLSSNMKIDLEQLQKTQQQAQGTLTELRTPNL